MTPSAATATTPSPWHARPATVVRRELSVDPARGLTSSEAARRAQRYGANRLIEPPREPRSRAFLRQFQWSR